MLKGRRYDNPDSLREITNDESNDSEKVGD